MGTLVYAYGCKRPDRDIRDAIEDQLWLAYRYRLALWRLSMAGREVYREQRRQHVPKLVEAEEELARAEEHLSTLDRKKEPEAHQNVRTDVKRLRTWCRELREAAKADAVFLAATVETEARRGVLQRALRNVFSRTLGLYSGTYLHVEAAARSANAGTEDPVRPRWDRSGVLAVQLQGGRSPVVLMSGKDPSIHIEPPHRKGQSKRRGSRTTVHYRLRSEKGAAVQVALPTMLHRDLPRDANITWAKLVVTTVHEFRQHYSIQFTLDTQEGMKVPTGAGLVAISFRDEKISYACEYGEEQVFDFNFRNDKIRDLQSIRDKHRNAAIHLLAQWCENQDETADWVREEIETINEHKSCRRLYHLRKKLSGLIDDALARYLDEWAYRENHLYWWQRDMTRSELLRRRDAHRVFAAQLRARFRDLVIDGRRLDDPRRLSAEVRDLGLSEFRILLLQAFGEHGNKATGESCAELCESFRAARPADSDKAQKKGKRTGFKNKHLEREEAARNATATFAE